MATSGMDVGGSTNAGPDATDQGALQLRPGATVSGIEACLQTARTGYAAIARATYQSRLGSHSNGAAVSSAPIGTVPLMRVGQGDIPGPCGSVRNTAKSRKSGAGASPVGLPGHSSPMHGTSPKYTGQSGIRAPLTALHFIDAAWNERMAA